MSPDVTGVNTMITFLSYFYFIFDYIFDFLLKICRFPTTDPKLSNDEKYFVPEVGLVPLVAF